MKGEGGDGGAGGPRFHRQLALLTSIGTSFAVTSAGGFVIGNWLDGKLGTRPWLTIVLGLMGVVGAFLNLIRTLDAVDKLEKKKAEPGDGGGTTDASPPGAPDAAPDDGEGTGPGGS